MALTCSFSPTWKEEGFSVKASVIVSMLLQQWNELSSVVWVLSFCSYHEQCVHINNTTVFITGPCSHECGLWKTSCSPSEDSWGTLYNCGGQLQLCHGFGFHLQYYIVMLPTASRYTHAPAWGWKRWTQFWWIYRLAHTFACKANCILQEPLAPGQWPMMWQITVYKQIDFLFALLSVTLPLSSFSVIFFNNTFLFSSLSY